jgi:MFS family permease
VSTTAPEDTDTQQSRPSATSNSFHGWRMVGFAGIVTAMTAPGQTAAVSVFVDPLITDLGLSRSLVSTAYLIGTLTGAAALPAVGRLVDRFGARLTMTVIAAAFGAVLIGLSTVTGIVGLTAGFVGIRLAGQGALGLVAATVVAHWFRRRRGTALGCASAVGAAGISLSPILLETLIDQHGWRTVWLLEGIAVWMVVIPIAALGIRNRPHDARQHVDGHPTDVGVGAASGVSRAEAVRTPYFWVLTASVAASGLLSTAVGFHQISLLPERGLSPAAAAANFLPRTVAGIAATLLTGVLLDRHQPRYLIITTMTALAVGVAWASVVTPGWSAIGFGVTLGAAAGATRTVEAGLTPRIFGTAHLGAIRGIVVAVSVASTAFGPVLFAVLHDATGTFTLALLAATALPAAVIAAALLAPSPAPAISDTVGVRHDDAPPQPRPAGPEATSTGRPAH